MMFGEKIYFLIKHYQSLGFTDAQIGYIFYQMNHKQMVTMSDIVEEKVRNGEMKLVNKRTD